MMYKEYAYRCATLQECCENLKDRLILMSDKTKNIIAENDRIKNELFCVINRISDYKELEDHDRLLAKQNKLLCRQNSLLRERCEILQKKLTETKN